MAFVCDWLLPQQSRQRDAALLQHIHQDRRKRRIVTQQLAREALATRQPRHNDEHEQLFNQVIHSD